MEKQNVKVGVLGTTGNGMIYDHTRVVEFLAEEVGRVTHYGLGRNGAPTDTRGTTETMYRTEDGRYIVYIQDWSHWQGEEDHYRLMEARPEDLEPMGRFGELAEAAGMSRPLTLDEALEAEGAER